MISGAKVTLRRFKKVEQRWLAACGSLRAQMRRVVRLCSVSKSAWISGVKNTQRRSEKVELC